MGLETCKVGYDFLDGSGVILGFCHFHQFARVGQTAGQFIDGNNNFFETRALLTERLRYSWFVPDVRLFQLRPDLG